MPRDVSNRCQWSPTQPKRIDHTIFIHSNDIAPHKKTSFDAIVIAQCTYRLEDEIDFKVLVISSFMDTVYGHGAIPPTVDVNVITSNIVLSFQVIDSIEKRITLTIMKNERSDLNRRKFFIIRRNLKWYNLYL